MLMKNAIVSCNALRGAGKARFAWAAFVVNILFSVVVFAEMPDAESGDESGSGAAHGRYGVDWFSNRDIMCSIGVHGYSFPETEALRQLNERVSRVIRGEIQGEQVQIRFSNGRFRWYVASEKLINYRLQTVLSAIEDMSLEVMYLTQLMRSKGVADEAVCIRVLKDFLNELNVFNAELHEIQNAPRSIQEREAFFERFCRFYRDALYPVLQWFDRRCFDGDDFYGSPWSIAVNQLTFEEIAVILSDLDALNYSWGGRVYRSIRERVEQVIGEWRTRVALSELEQYKLRIYFLIQSLREVGSPSNKEVIEWLEDALDEELQSAILFSALDAGPVIEPPVRGSALGIRSMLVQAVLSF